MFHSKANTSQNCSVQLHFFKHLNSSTLFLPVCFIYFLFKFMEIGLKSMLQKWIFYLFIFQLACLFIYYYCQAFWGALLKEWVMTFFKVNNQIRSFLSAIFSCRLVKMSSRKGSCFKLSGKQLLRLLSEMIVKRNRKYCYLVAFNLNERQKAVINVNQEMQLMQRFQGEMEEFYLFIYFFLLACIMPCLLQNITQC